MRNMKPALMIKMAESEVILVDQTAPENHDDVIPYSQIIGAALQMQSGNSEFLIYTPSGINKLVFWGNGKDIKEAVLALFENLKNKLGDFTRASIAEDHNSWLMKETWSFYTPTQFPNMAA